MMTIWGNHMRARSAVMAGCALALVVSNASVSNPAIAQDVKDLMGRSQSQSQQRAVEDLIKKLQGGTAAAKDSVPAPLAAPQRMPSAEPPGTALPAPAASPAPPPGDTKPQIAVSPPPRPPDRETVTSDPEVTPPTPAPASVAPAVRPVVQPAVREAAPTAPPVRVEAAAIDAMPSVDIEIYFDYNSAAITGQAAATLSVLAQALKDPRLVSARFLIGGHTDAKGGGDFNLDLSEQRATSVRRYLIEMHGIDAARLVAQGFGMQRLKVPGRPMDVQNRRVQVVNLTAQRDR
jgi:outer membrane protein OmpA-like peptidoglycan-associated protein